MEDFQTPSPTEEEDAKVKFAELYPQWNALSPEEREQSENQPLKQQLSALYETICKDEARPVPISEILAGPKETATEVETVETEMAASPDTTELKKEKLANVSSFGNPFYSGNADVNPDNDTLIHAGDDYQKNLNKEIFKK